jgi:penicillin-binding protein 1B
MARKKSPSTSTRAKARPARKAPARKAPTRGRGSWVRLLVVEGAVVVAGIAAGLAITGGLLWRQAVADVDTWQAREPMAEPTVVYSAPIEVRAGMRADPGLLASDLLAAGYERVDHLVEPAAGAPGAFAVDDSGVSLWTGAWSGPTGEVEAGRVAIRIEEGVVTDTTPDHVVLRPTVLGTLGDPDAERTPVRLPSLSRWVEPALLAMEDSRFRTHPGFDPLGLARALFTTATGGPRQGGSTLTQQLAKNLFLTQDRTVKRKVREVFFAAALESRFTKDELLELYLSEVYLGQMGGLPLHGVEAAARAWFGTSAARLTLQEAATIVGVIPSPNTWSPSRHPQAARDRRDVVLRRMRELDLVTEADLDGALAAPVVLRGLSPSRVRAAPYAVDAAVERAEAALGPGALTQRGYRVYTGIQPLLQRAAEAAVRDGMASVDAEYPKAAGAEAALVAARTDDGTVVALVGGRSYADSPFDRATDARRLLGSTIKPLTVLEAFDLGKLTPATRVADEPISRTVDGKAWQPSNDDGEYLGAVTVRTAIEGSRNIPAIHMAELVGAHALQRHLRDAGLTGATNLPSAALGAFPVSPIELLGAYTALSAGTAWRPRLVLAITDTAGQLVLELPPDGVRIASPQAAAQVERILEGVITSGTGARAARYGVGPPAAGKTGTTDGFRDAWFAGLTPSLAAVVWVGRDEDILGLSGSRAALPAWARFVDASGTVRGSSPRPGGLVDVAICSESGGVARDVCPEASHDLFVRGTEPNSACDLHGGPAVKAGRLFGGLFKKRNVDEPVGSAAPGEVGARD